MSTSTDATASTAERYRAFADVEARGLSACYEDWAHGVAGDHDTIEELAESIAVIAPATPRVRD